MGHRRRATVGFFELQAWFYSDDRNEAVILKKNFQLSWFFRSRSQCLCASGSFKSLRRGKSYSL